VRDAPPAWLWLGTVLGGLGLGAASVYPYVYTSGPLHILGNSAAVWLLFAFAVGAIAGRPVRGAVAGTVLLIATVLAFFAIYKLLFPEDHVGRVAAFWLGTAVVGGPVFGLAGGFWRTGEPLSRGLSSAMLGGAFVAEAIAFQPTQGRLWQWVEAAFGVALCFVLALGRRARLVAAVALPVFVGIGLLGWIVTKHAIHISLT
jgi:Family of unknown function (DUF6518)